jgi:hypothetical protein
LNRLKRLVALFRNPSAIAIVRDATSAHSASPTLLIVDDLAPSSPARLIALIFPIN